MRTKEMGTSAKRVKLSESETPSKRTRDVEVTIDSSILGCPICFGPLRRPLFQCINGHVACFECKRKLVGKCPTCSTTAISRCIPFESLIKSCKMKCTYAYSGCPVSLPYNYMTTHELRCRYVPCTCPIPDCNFTCKEFLMSLHIDTEHASYEQQTKFDYDEWFSVMVENEEPYILRSPNCVYMLLSRRIDLGYALGIVHVSESAPRRYKLEVGSIHGNSLTLKEWTENLSDLDEKCCPDLLMYLPPNVMAQ